MKRRFLLPLLLLAGCSLVKPPDPEPAKLALTALPQRLPHAERPAGVLLVQPTSAAEAYDTTRMAYSEQPNRIGYFRDHEWAEPPQRMIHRLLVRALEQTGAFRTVVTAPDSTPGGSVLRTELLTLLQDDTRQPPLLRLAVRFELQGASGRAVASREIDIERPMESATAPAGAAAANEAVAELVQKLAEAVVQGAR
jgi:cholesterol transport system auxiliary component